MPSWRATFHAPAYHAHVTPLAVSVSPMVFCVCGARVWRAGSVRRGVPARAGRAPRVAGRVRGVHGEAVGGDGAVQEVWRAVEHGSGRAGARLEPTPLVDLGPQGGTRAVVLGRAGADQPEVVQVGAAVGPHEEVVGEHVVR